MSLLILHGLYGNGPGHWQEWLAGEAAAAGMDVRYPALPEKDAPTPDAWLAALDAELADLDPDALQVAAHSLACHLWAMRAGRGDLRAARVLLVAPPSARELAAVCPTFPTTDLAAQPLLAACADTTLVLGEDDPYRPSQDAFRRTGVATQWLAGGGHINVDSGYGEWPHALRWVLGGDPPGERLADRPATG
jgi:predicted alpha/beta hydrolase family esterase